MKICSVLSNVVSSAYIMGDNFGLAKARSLIYIKKSSGPRIDPWGTPVDIVYVVDLIVNFNILQPVVHVAYTPL